MIDSFGFEWSVKRADRIVEVIYHRQCSRLAHDV